jgi:hypothetical protein
LALAGKDVRIAVRKHDNISGHKGQNGAVHVRKCPAFDNQMINDEMRTSGRQDGGEMLGGGRINAPGRRELGIEVQSPVQLDPAQDIRKSVHDPLWTLSKFAWLTGKSIRRLRIPGQKLATPEHG